MTVFKSSITLNRPLDKVYSFLADLNNHKFLMPDNIEDWMSTIDTATFNIRNMTRVSLAITNRTENQEILIVATEEAPFNLELKWNVTKNLDKTDVVYTITADLNMMMKILASAPLQKLADSETQNLYHLLAN